ncbi:MAG: manganese efflux pump MntP family protein [Treponema sp.]|jgi:putative Mn2+ efflux pump MntP|nr:manganese efflux pump MntP family protein [Treponema sp.]
MGFGEIVIIAVGLSMDAFAVSITLGLSVEKPTIKEILMPGLYFGLFQALMPAVGYMTSFYFANKIQHLDHWIAFALLGLIGGKMIKDSLSQEHKEKKLPEYSFNPMKMLLLALATSIDALAIGITFAFFDVPIVKAAIITGLITFFIAMIGVKIGNLFGMRYKSKAEFAGGLMLVIIGIKTVIEHILGDTSVLLP